LRRSSGFIPYRDGRYWYTRCLLWPRSSGVMPPSPVVVDVPTSVAPRPSASFAGADSAPNDMPAIVTGILSSSGTLAKRAPSVTSVAQRGRLLVCGGTGEALGDSIYEARLYVRGEVAGLGADCVEKEVRDEHLAEIRELLEHAGIEDVQPAEFRRYGSERRLYNFHVDNAY